MDNTKKASFPMLLLLIGLTLSGLFIFLFAELAEEMLEQEMQGFDNMVIQWFKSIENPSFTTAMIAITELGSVWFLTTLSILVLLILGFKYKDKWTMLFFITAVAGGGAMTWLLKHFYQRGRPSINPDIDAIGFSFPSGHSMGSLIFYGFFLYLVIRSRLSKSIKWLAAVLMVILIVLIGASRIYLGAHFPSDVLAGHLAGGIWLILCLLALEWTTWQSQSSIPARPVYTLRKWLIKGWQSFKRFTPDRNKS